MTRRDKKHEERKVRASDFAMYQTAESRPTGLHHIFDAFHRECSASTTVETSLSARSEGASSVYVEAGSELIKALDKLTKRDGTTKLKALETLEALLETTPDYVVEGVMPDFMHVFKRLAVVEPLRKIRVNLGRVLCRIAVMLKRRMQGFMENMVTHWFLAMHDDAQDVAAVYVEAFNSLFTTAAASREESDRRTFRVLTHYIQKIASTSIFLLSRDIESYKRDWLDVFGKTCDNCATLSDIHNRLVCSVLQSLTDLMIYQRQYGADVCPDERPVSVFLNSEFVAMVSSQCRSSSFRQRLTSVRLMVEFVKVLGEEHLQLAKELFKISIQRIYADEEPAVTYQHIRLICACARYNSVCWEPVVLNNYESLLKNIIDKYRGDFVRCIELYSLFPCLVSYLPQDWLRSPCGVEAVLNVAAHLLQLMRDKVNKNYETSFTFDAKLFSQVGSSMLYCYYRILLLLGDCSDALVQHAFAPIAQLQCEDSATAHYFVSELPRIFTEFIEESVVFRESEASDTLLSLLRDIQSKQSNRLFMARIFARISSGYQRLRGEGERHVQLRLYARDAQAKLKSHIMNYELPSLVLEFLECPSSGPCLNKVNDMLSVVDDVKLDSIAPDSRIFELPQFLMSHKYADAWEFESAFGVLSRALVLFKPMLETPLKHFPVDTHPACLLLVSLLALKRCDSAEGAVEIAKRIYETRFIAIEGNVLAVILKFIQASQRFASVLSRSMLSWLFQHPHVSAVTCNAVYDCIDVTSLDEDALLSYELLHVTMQLGQKTPSKSYKIVNHLLVDDLVSFYLLGYYVNSPVKLEVLLKFSLELLPCWRNGQSCADTGRLTSFLQLLLQDHRNIQHKNDALDEGHVTKDVVYTMLAMQGTPCRATKSISRALSALPSEPGSDTVSTYYRNAILFSHLWLMNCERYLSSVAQSVPPCMEEGNAADLQNQTKVTSDEVQVDSSESLGTASHSVEDTIGCFSDIFVVTFVHSGFSCLMFEKLADKLIELNLCTDVITDTLVRYFCAVTWRSKFELDSKLNLFSSYLRKSAAHASTMIDLFKQHYTVNQFMGGFVSAINRVNSAPVTLLDDLLLLLEACGEFDVVVVTNILSEMTQLFEDAVSISQGIYTLKCMADSEYLFGQMAKVPLVVFGRLSMLGRGGDDVVSTCWLHHALIAFFHSCVNVMKALHLDVSPLLNLVGSAWLMSVLNFCYLEMYAPTNMTIELLSDVILFCLSHNLVSLEDLKARATAYDYSRESAMEYAQVMEALSNDNLSRVLATSSMEESLDAMDPHYMITMMVHMLESADAYLAAHADSTYMQSSAESLKLAAYKFLEVCSKSKMPYAYSLCMISRLWRCSFLFSNIAEYSGALCKVDLERSTLFLMLPGSFVSNAITPSTQTSAAPKPVPVDVAQMLFNLLQDPEEEQEVDREEVEESVKTPKSHVSELTSLRGRKAIAFYLNLVLGPYLTDALFRIYAIYVASGDHSDVEMCLTAWLSVFALFKQLKKSNQPTVVNSLVKILTVKPADAGGVVYEALVSEVTDATAAVGEEYVDAWWLEGEPEIPDGTEDSALHVLLQVLVLCLEHLECREERHRNLVKTLYYRVSETFPEEVNHVWNRCRNTYVKKQIMKFTKNEITQRLITDELEILKRSKSRSLHISHDADHRTLYVSLDTKAEVSVKLTVKIPATFPLEPLSFVSTDDVGTFKNKHLRWLMMAQSAANRSGISQGLLLWSENITNFFEGIEECPICYSIVHLQFNTIPGKTCKVCKHKFHTECLYKWFRNAPKAKCPLCQSHVSFTSYN